MVPPFKEQYNANGVKKKIQSQKDDFPIFANGPTRSISHTVYDFVD